MRYIKIEMDDKEYNAFAKDKKKLEADSHRKLSWKEYFTGYLYV